MLLIARIDNIESIFFVVSRGREQLAAIAICELSIARSGDKTSVFFMSYRDERATTTTFFTSYCLGANDDTTIQASRGREGQLRGYGAAHHATIKHYILSIARSDDDDEHIHMSYRERSDDDYILDVAKWSYC